MSGYDHLEARWDWITKANQERIRKEIIGDKTLIGACGDCEWWTKFEDCDRMYCDNMDTLVDACDSDFGCRHWEKRND